MPTPNAAGSASPTVAETLTKLGVDPKVGLNPAELQEHFNNYGPNALAEEKKSALSAFFAYFWGPIPWMIEAAALMALVVKDWGDFTIITSLLLFNALLGFWEEHQASNALDALKSSLALKARVLRGGKWEQVDARTLVPGDIIRLYLGDVVPADCKLIQGDYISIDQSALTGESLPVSKKSGEDAYSGSIVKQGEMVAVITATGGNTFFGRTAKLVAGAGSVSHFQRAVMKIGNFLIILALVLVVILVASRLFDMRGHYDRVVLLRLAEIVLILLVASVPVAMPAVLSVTMALGARMLARSKAIVSRLESIEELAGVDVLCSDKTGTLTQNKLTLGEAQPWSGTDTQTLILMASLASRAADNDPIDLAIMAGLKGPSVLKSYQQEKYVPFDPVDKRTEATIKDASSKVFRVSKGAPQVILGLAKLSGTDLEKAQQAVNGFASQGYRTIGVAVTQDDDHWSFLGILPLLDPPRPDSKSTIARARAYGVQVKMVTGDNVAIARQISLELDMGANIQPATELFPGDVIKGQIPLDAAEKIDQADGFAQVFPEHKYAIVKILQENGHIVGMTGDGVNDAPALKQADVGIAVSGATEAARAAAALILTAPGLSVIIEGIAEARRIFRRMTSYVLYRNRHDHCHHGICRASVDLLPFLSSHRDHAYRARPPGRCAHYDHRLRQCQCAASTGEMGVRPGAGYFVGAGVTWSYSKLWSALPRRHASSPGSSTPPNHDVLAARCWWSPDVIRDSYTRSFLETAVSEPEAFLRNCRDPNRRGANVQRGVARAVTSLENHRLCLGL